MRIIITIFIISFCVLPGSTQNENANWVTGQDRLGIGEFLLFKFTENKVQRTTLKKDNVTYLNGNSATYSHPTTGELILFTDGFRLYDHNLDVLFNGDSLTRGDYEEDIFQNNGGRLHPNQSAFIPSPQNKDEVFLINVGVVKGLGFSKLTYNKIDLNKSKATIIEKNVFLSDNIISFYPFIIKHANGRDWWIIESTRSKNFGILGFNFYILGKEGITFSHYQESELQNSIRHATNTIGINIGVSNFTYDSNELVLLFSDIDVDAEGLYNEVHFLNFDRCEGLFYNFNKKTIPNDLLPKISFKENKKEVFNGSVLSPDGRYLYLVSPHNIVQYDLQLKDWETKGINLYSSDHPVTMINATYGLNHKIYFNEIGPLFFDYKVINKPHRRGIDADFSLTSELSISNQDSFGFNRTMPSYVNYNLGPIDGSSCDTLGLDNNVDALFRHDTLGKYTGKVDFMDLSNYNPQEWAWDFDDGNTSTERYPIHQYAEAGTYNVCLTASNENGSDTYCHDVVIDGVVATKGTELISFSIYPNPVSDMLYIENGHGYDGHIEIHAIDGRSISRYNLTGVSTQEVDISELRQGSYILSVITDSHGEQRMKLMVE